MDKKEQKMSRVLLASSILFSIFVLSIFSTFVSGAVNMVSPPNGTNASGSVLLNFTFVNATDIESPTNANTTFYSNASGSFVAITTANALNCSATACWKTATASELTDGIGATIFVRVGNYTKAAGYINSTNNVSKITFYTNNATCSYTIDHNTVKFGDVIGVKVTDGSTKDTLFTLTYNYTLYDQANNIQLESASASPSLTGLTAWDTIGTYTLASVVKDTVGNQIVCSNQSIFVKGNDDDVVPIATATVQQQASTQPKNGNGLLFLLGGVLVVILGVVAVIFIINGTKKSKRR